MGRDHAPVGHTCPDIDKVIASINAAIKAAASALKSLQNDDDPFDDVKEYLGTIDNELYGVEDKLENLRKSNDALRTWGNEETERANREEARADAAESDRDDAISRADDAEATIKDLETDR